MSNRKTTAHDVENAMYNLSGIYGKSPDYPGLSYDIVGFVNKISRELVKQISKDVGRLLKHKINGENMYYLEDHGTIYYIVESGFSPLFVMGEVYNKLLKSRYKDSLKKIGVSSTILVGAHTVILFRMGEQVMRLSGIACKVSDNIWSFTMPYCHRLSGEMTPTTPIEASVLKYVRDSSIKPIAMTFLDRLGDMDITVFKSIDGDLHYMMEDYMMEGSDDLMDQAQLVIKKQNGFSPEIHFMMLYEPDIIEDLWSFYIANKDVIDIYDKRLMARQLIISIKRFCKEITNVS